MRLVGLEADDGSEVADEPTSALFDFAAAFSSVSHKWLFAALRAAGAPIGFYLAICALYDGSRVVTPDGPRTELFCMILAGILQGCPLSGTLFIIAVDPFLRALVGATQSRGSLVRACADDIWIVAKAP